MPTTFEHSAQERSAEQRFLGIEAGGSLVEAVGGLGVIVLSVLGLTGIAPEFLASIAGIVFGVALLAEGTAIASEFSMLFAKITNGPMGAVQLGGGMTIEITAGIATMVLGVLALVGLAPDVLLPALVIAAGGTLILTTGTLQRLNNLKMEVASVPEIAQRVAQATVSGAAAAQLLSGLATVVLGILALVAMQGAAPASAAVGAASAMPVSWLTLTLVGLLVLGASIMMSGGTLTGRFLQMFSHEQGSPS